MHELKSIVLEFIRQIRKLDFEREADIKLLYEKAKDIISGSNKWTASFRTFKNARKALSRILWSVMPGAPTGPRGPALQEFLTGSAAGRSGGAVAATLIFRSRPALMIIYIISMLWIWPAIRSSKRAFLFSPINSGAALVYGPSRPLFSALIPISPDAPAKSSAR